MRLAYSLPVALLTIPVTLTIVFTDDRLSVNLSLTLLAPPNIIRMENKVARDLGESVNVTCRATGNPAPSVKWITKTVSGPVSSLDLDNQTLQINNIQEEHFKEYVCLAKNRFGNDTLAFALGKC